MPQEVCEKHWEHCRVTYKLPMHELEPYYSWRELYRAEDDERSPFFGTEHSEFAYSNKVYNYFIHPQWDYFGSNTLYLKLLYTDYDRNFAIIEMIGEWNDCIDNDVMYLKREVIDPMIKEGIYHFILIGENVLNFHASDDCYYQEWLDDIQDEGGWIAALNFREHVIEEMRAVGVHYFINFGENLNRLYWRKFKPLQLIDIVDDLILKALA